MMECPDKWMVVTLLLMLWALTIVMTIWVRRDSRERMDHRVPWVRKVDDFMNVVLLGSSYVVVTGVLIVALYIMITYEKNC